MGDFELNTSSMDKSAEGCHKLAELMQELKVKLNTEKNNALFYWSGKGCNEFQKQYRLLVQQLTDITDNLWETAERILAAEEAYIQTDTNAAKQLDGAFEKGVVDNADDQISSIYASDEAEADFKEV